MGNYTTNPLRAGQENEKATGLDTLGGEFGLCWNDTVPLTTGAHNAFLSAFFEAGGVDLCRFVFKIKTTSARSIREVKRLRRTIPSDD